MFIRKITEILERMMRLKLYIDKVHDLNNRFLN